MTRRQHNSQHPKKIRITDLSVASYLLSLDYPLVAIEGTPQRIEFVFDAPEDAVLRFYQGDCTVNARKILDAVKNIKGLVAERHRGWR